MRFALTVCLVFLAITAPSSADTGERAKTAQVGQVLVLKFPGNHQGGYRWLLNRTRSTGLDRVTVKDLGWTIHGDRGSILTRKASVMRISVMPNIPGQATLAFDYVLAGYGRRAFRTKVIRLEITSKSADAR